MFRTILHPGAFLVIGLFFFLSCKSSFHTEAPTHSVVPSPAFRELSNLNAPIRIDLKALEKIVNEKYKSLLYEDNSFDNNNRDNIILRIDKRNKILIGSEGGKIQVQVPMKIKLKYRFSKRVLGMDLETIQDANLNVSIKLSSKPEMSKTWKPGVKTTTDIQWDDLNDFNFGIDISKGINEIIKGQLQKISALIDEQMVQAIDLKKEVAEYWGMMQAPFLMDQENSAWLVAEPKSVYMTPFLCENNKVSFELGVKSFVEVIMGDKPIRPAASPLPDLIILKDLPDDFSLSLGAELGYRQMEQIINKQVKDSSFFFDGNKSHVTIKSVEIYGAGNNLIVGVDLDGKVKSGILGKKISGKFFFQGQPVYDSLAQAIRIQNFDFDMKSKDVLLKAANWLVVNKKFRQNMEKKLVFPVSAQLAQARELATKAMNQRINGLANVSGQLTHLEPMSIQMMEKAVRLNIRAKGKVQLGLEGMD
jgi:hypothetical protein